jgi:hypothetical protein
MATPDPPDQPLAPLPSWQLFASVTTQSELLDDVAMRHPDQVAEPPAGVEVQATSQAVRVPDPLSDPLATSAFAVATPGPDPAQVAEQAAGAADTPTLAAPHAAAHKASPSDKVPAFTAAAAPKAQAVRSPLVDLQCTIRRSIFLPPLPGLADVEPGVEPAVRAISPVGSDYVPGSLGRAIKG